MRSIAWSGSGAITPLRRLAQLSILFAMATLVGTAGALVLLPNAVELGQWILMAVGGSLAAVAFAFGVMISLRSAWARPFGFVVVAAAVPTAALFGLLAYVVPDARWIFAVWAVAVLAYATLTTQRLVRWSPGDLADQPRSSVGIFISYRRQDSRDTVGRIHDHLRRAFDEDRLFLDVDRQAAGEDYRAVIRRALEHADVVLVAIGPRWLDATDRNNRRRIDQPDDMVRIELETAFVHDVRVVPVLVEGATMPAPADLPVSLQPLCYRTAIPVRPDPDFRTDMQRLVENLRAPAEERHAAVTIAH